VRQRFQRRDDIRQQIGCEPRISIVSPARSFSSASSAEVSS
jgi:hypothetical protein